MRQKMAFISHPSTPSIFDPYLTNLTYMSKDNMCQKTTLHNVTEGPTKTVNTEDWVLKGLE